MELIVITLTLCTSLFLVMLAPSASQQIHVQSSHRSQGQDVPVSVLALPRKLRLLEDVKVNGGDRENLSSFDKMKGSFSGKRHRKESGMVHARGSGTMEEWREGIDPSEFFTMDYAHVSRRRPVHNKSLPVGP